MVDVSFSLVLYADFTVDWSGINVGYNSSENLGVAAGNVDFCHIFIFFIIVNLPISIKAVKEKEIIVLVMDQVTTGSLGISVVIALTVIGEL